MYQALSLVVTYKSSREEAREAEQVEVAKIMEVIGVA
jgi:hypothetical protein